MKAAITVFEIALLAIFTTIFIAVYNIVAQSTVENIILRTSNSLQDQECSLTMITLFGQDYVRNQYVDVSGSYEDLVDFYDIEWEGLPQEFNGMKFEYGAKINAKCVMYVFDPYEMYEGRQGYEVISGV